MDPQPDDHYVEVGRKRRWSVLKILATFGVVLLIFGSGVAVGKGNVRIWDPNAVSSQNTNLSSLNYASVDSVYSILKKDFDGNLNQTKLNEGLKKGLVEAAGDPYTVYFNPTDAKAFNNELSGTIVGIGAELGTDADNNIVIVSPLSGYPAEKAGLKPKDIVAGVDKESTQGKTVDAIVRKIRGKENTDVILTIVRGDEKPFQVTITRQKITVPSVKYSIDGNIGYIKINQFTNDTVELTQKAAQEFKDKGVKGIVLDLRSDPGGYLKGAVEVSSLWIDKGKTVVQERRGGTVISTEQATGGNILKGIPTVVLIDGGSASASEITAGALRDSGAAQLVGVKSFGKGSVQQVENLPDGSELKITIARWFTPNGKNIDKQGITPDVIVEPGADDSAASGKDTQKAKAYAVVQAKIH
ncbi:S41 family peptidase [Candidatus Saccharibacteria bacterium]|nr:S41 family peptidase [Candidatus Saccharibacteria bacterium]